MVRLQTVWGYRDICLNLEVAWTISSESDEALDFLPVYDSQGRSWDAMPHIRTHICEVQLPAGEHVHTQGDRVPRELCRSPQLSRAVRHLSALFL